MFGLSAVLFKAQLAERLPHLWELILPSILKDYVESNSKKSMSIDDANKIVYSLQVLEVMAPCMDKSLLPRVLECLNSMCELLANPFKFVRHMAARCIAVLATLDLKEVSFSVKDLKQKLYNLSISN